MGVKKRFPTKSDIKAAVDPIWTMISSRKGMQESPVLQSAATRLSLVVQVVERLSHATRVQIEQIIAILNADPVPNCKNFEQFVRCLLDEGFFPQDIRKIIVERLMDYVRNNSPGNTSVMKKLGMQSPKALISREAFPAVQKNENLFIEEFIKLLLGEMEDEQYEYTLDEISCAIEVAIIEYVLAETGNDPVKTALRLNSTSVCPSV